MWAGTLVDAAVWAVAFVAGIIVGAGGALVVHRRRRGVHLRVELDTDHDDTRGVGGRHDHGPSEG